MTTIGAAVVGLEVGSAVAIGWSDNGAGVASFVGCGEGINVGRIVGCIVG